MPVMSRLVSWSLDSAGVMYRARRPSGEAAGYHRETISSRAPASATQGSGRAVSLSQTDVVPAGYGPVGSGRPGAPTRITDSTATFPGARWQRVAISGRGRRLLRSGVRAAARRLPRQLR